VHFFTTVISTTSKETALKLTHAGMLKSKHRYPVLCGIL